jgi:predicted nucleotidyltransferase
MTAAELPLSIDREAIARFCRERGIRRLSLFGSVLRQDFDPARSDVDVLVELAEDARPGFRFFGYADDLAKELGGRVDLNTPAKLSPLFRAEAQREALLLCEQA